MRELVKKLLRPLLRVRVLGRLLRILVAIWRGPVIASRLDQIEGSHAELEGRHAHLSGAIDSMLDTVTQVASWQREMDADRENLVRSVPVALRRLRREQASAELELKEAELKLKQLSESVGWLLDRAESVRSQAPPEIGNRLGVEGRPVEPVETHVKIDLGARTGALRVNLGCGHASLPGYVNVNNRDLPSVDVVADVYALPFEDGTVAEFYSSHFIEHFPLEEFRRRLLPALRSKLAPGGIFRAVVADVDAMMRAYVAGDYPFDDVREVVYGCQNPGGDFHYNMFTPSSLTELLTAGGFSAVTIVEAERVNGKSPEFEIEAIRG